MKQWVLLFVWLYLGTAAWAARKADKVYKVCSPDKQLELCIEQSEDGKFVYQFSADGTLLILRWDSFWNLGRRFRLRDGR